MIDGTLEPIPKLAAPTIANLKKLVLHNNFFTLDIETAPELPRKPWTGKDPLKAKLKLLGVGCIDWGMSINPAEPSHRPAYQYVKTMVENPNLVMWWQNGEWFDKVVLERYGFKFMCKLFDTRDARRALSATSRLNLGFMASIYADAHPWKKNEEDDSKGLVLFGTPEQLRPYNAYDCAYTARVVRGIESEDEWKSERVQRLYDVHVHLSRIAAKMYRHGIPIDRERLIWMKWALLKEYNERLAAFLQAVNIPGFRCQPEHLRALIYQRHATGKYAGFGKFNLPDPYDPDMYTNKEDMDTCSVDEDSLTQLLIDPSSPLELKQLIKLYWAAEGVWKQRSTFVASESIRHAIDIHWRMHPGWNSCGTDTGRFSASAPNPMNIQKILRWMYKAKPGRMLVGADFSQLELRVMAAISKDPMLSEALATGDVYTKDAIEWFGLPAETTKETCNSKIRKSCKIIHLGAQYAASTPTIHRQALQQDHNFEWQMTRTLHAKWLKTYSGTVAYWKDEQERVRQTGYSESRILHRRRVYPRDPPPTETANYPIQGTASDITNLAMIELDARLSKEVPDAMLIIQLHDAFAVDAREKDVPVVQRILQETMEQEHRIDGDKYVLPVEVTIGESWDQL